MNLSENIKKLRAEKNLTQEQLAEKLQVSRSTISSWETQRSYPDLTMVIAICDCFDVSLDCLLREDEKMVKKLNFGIKQKRILITVVVLLTILLVNTVLSTLSFPANPKSLSISNVRMIRDLSYNGENPDRDWNTSVVLSVKSKNVFFKPAANDLLIFNDDGNLELQTNWSFSIFNIFDVKRTVQANHSILLKDTLTESDIKLSVKGDGSKKSIPFMISGINN